MDEKVYTVITIMLLLTFVIGVVIGSIITEKSIITAVQTGAMNISCVKNYATNMIPYIQP